MILFRDDFLQTPALIHSETTNNSFLHMHAILKKMGIQNNIFFLALTQPELKNINVRTLTDPSQELALRITYECKINPWYYFREVCTVPGQGAGISYRLNRGNLALNWLFFNGIDVYLVLPRQTGKTMSTQAIVNGVMYIWAEKYTFSMLTKDGGLVEDNVRRLKEIRDNLPSFLVLKNKMKDTENKQSISYHARNTHYDTYIGNRDIIAADKLVRGASIAAAHIDEIEYFPNIHITYPVLLAAESTASEQAKDQHLPHSNILTSTAGMLDTEACQYALSLVNQAMPFTEVLYDCKDSTDLESLVNTNSTNRMVYAQFSYKQLGYTEEWFQNVISRGNMTQEQIKRDYLGIRTSGTEDPVIDPELLKKIKIHQKEPVWTEVVPSCNYVFRWYEHPSTVFNLKSIKEKTILLGLDTSENIGKDFTSLVMMDAQDMSVLCVARCNESDLIKLAMYIAELMIKYSNIFLIPERKSTASMMISLICTELRKHNINPFSRIFNMIIQNKTEKPFNEINLHEPYLEEGTNKKYLGFPTTGSGETSRDSLYKITLLKTLDMNATRINDATLIYEVSSLTRRNGRVDHSTVGHDDTLIAYLLCCWVIYFGKNLSLYSTPNSSMLSRITANGNEIDQDVKKSQELIIERLEVLEAKVKHVQNDVVRAALDREIKHLSSLIDPTIRQEAPISADQLIKEKTPNTVDIWQQLKWHFK